MTNILLIVLTIIIVVIIVYNNNNSPELYGETLQYLGKIVANYDIDCNKNLIVNNSSNCIPGISNLPVLNIFT